MLDGRKEIKVLCVIESLGLGGAERLLVSLLPHISKGKIHVDVVSLFTDTSLSQELEERGIKVLSFNIAHRWNIFSASDRLISEYELSPCNWEDILDVLDVKYIDSIGTGSDIIRNLKPSFVIGWGSTSLCESLNMGVIPISLSKKSEIRPDSIYPIVKRTLSWHDEKKQIISAVNQQADYCKILRALTN